MARSRVTVTLPEELLIEVDRHDPNRSRFIHEAVARELERRRRELLRQSLASPHPESEELANLGLGDWIGKPDDQDLLDPAAGTAVRWIPGEGWRTLE